MNTTQVINRHTTAFLSTLLQMADNPDDKVRPFIDKTVNDFAPAFIEGADKFVNAFAAYLEAKGKGHLIDAGERSFGGNVYFSLSGHGCGFFDDKNEEVKDLQEVIQEWSGFDGRSRRFEELDTDLDIDKRGKIDICVLSAFIEDCRNALFDFPEVKTPERKTICAHTPGPWKAVNTEEHNTRESKTMVIGGDSIVVASVYNPFTRKFSAREVAANAHLISSAPDLLSALEDCVESLSRLPDTDGAYRVTCLQQARAAIAKAKGLQ